MSKLDRDFFTRNDVVQISQDLLGKVLLTKVNGEGVTAGIIVETEAYNGRTDRACHAFPDKRTGRTEIMYQTGGISYIYLCYGIHHLFNIVTNEAELADAVLIRAIEPIEGIETMLLRRNMPVAKTNLTAGPGSLAKAMGMDKNLNGVDLLANQIWVEDQGIKYTANEIIASPRVGVDYAGEDAKLPWRFRVKGNKWTSPAK